MYVLIEVKNLKENERDHFFEMLWAFSEMNEQPLQGIFEGDAFSEIPDECDSDLPPRSRDWIAEKKDFHAQLYFYSLEGAQKTFQWIQAQFPHVLLSDPEEKEEEDWNKKWKEGFQSFSIEPFYFIYPPWEVLSEQDQKKYKYALQINPGSGFGTGTHETTQMCLEVLAHENEKGLLTGHSFLDFGCGSGILSIALAAQNQKNRVLAIDIDELALENARENAERNTGKDIIQDKIYFHQYLPSINESGLFDGIVANILKNVLLEFSETLIKRLKPGGWFLISGLLEHDIPIVQAHYEKMLGRKAGTLVQKNEWRALYWPAVDI